jgi:hypothetical protein
MDPFREAVGAGDVEAARALAARIPVHTAVLVEGESDRVAVETLAGRLGRTAEGVRVVPIGGAMSIRRYLWLGDVGPRLLGLCDAREEPYFRRALADVYVCVADLEDELIRALGAPSVERVVAALGDLRRLRTFQQQPAQQGRTVEQQLRRFLGTTSGRKARYAGSLVQALDLTRVPRPLERLVGDL